MAIDGESLSSVQSAVPDFKRCMHCLDVNHLFSALVWTCIDAELANTMARSEMAAIADEIALSVNGNVAVMYIG